MDLSPPYPLPFRLPPLPRTMYRGPLCPAFSPACIPAAGDLEFQLTAARGDSLAAGSLG
jgi:hypothetical protein